MKEVSDTFGLKRRSARHFSQEVPGTSLRLGILGGSFNPIHLGHLILAESAREQCRLDRVLFMPTATPPHKSSRGLLDGAQRLAMVRLALRGHPAFQASDLELRLGGVSYTLRTIRALHARYPKAKLFVMIGADMTQVRWYGMSELSRLCTFVVAPRPDSKSRRIHGMRRIDMPLVDISSSMIRDRLRRRQSIRYLVPDAVERYLIRHRLFRGGA